MDYFRYRYNIQNGRTLFGDVQRLAPAHFSILDLKTGSWQTERYWRLQFGFEGAGVEAQEAFDSLLNEEISLQQSADVPVGMYLSGGIDSGAILHGFSRVAPDIESFTIRFFGKQDEWQRVQSLTDQYRFSQKVIDFGTESFASLDEAVYSLEEPFGDLLICANFELARLAAATVKVVLSGEGGDELLCGYDHQRAFLRLAAMPAFLRSAAAAAMGILGHTLVGRLQSYPGGFGPGELGRVRAVTGTSASPADAYLRLVSLFEPAELSSLFSATWLRNQADAADEGPVREIFDRNETLWQRVMRVEVEQLTLIVNLLKQERFGMRFSLESCVPLVSRRLLGLVASLPRKTVVTKTNKAMLLRYSGQPKVKKAPFSILGSGAFIRRLHGLYDENVLTPIMLESGIFEPDRIRSLRGGIEGGGFLALKQAMAVVVFGVWLRRYSGMVRLP